MLRTPIEKPFHYTEAVPHSQENSYSPAAVNVSGVTAEEIVLAFGIEDLTAGAAYLLNQSEDQDGLQDAFDLYEIAGQFPSPEQITETMQRLYKKIMSDPTAGFWEGAPMGQIIARSMDTKDDRVRNRVGGALALLIKKWAEATARSLGNAEQTPAIEAESDEADQPVLPEPQPEEE